MDLAVFGATLMCVPFDAFRERRDPVGCDLSALVHLQKELPCYWYILWASLRMSWKL